MSRARCAAAVTAALLAVGGAPARAAGGPPVAVNVQFAEFGPSQLDVLPGETVEWTNVSERDHTVTSDAGAFASDDLLSGDRFSVRFDDPGAFPYHCTIHAGMIGEVDVRGVILGPVPTAVVPAGRRVELTGRTADPARPVRIERGPDFAPVAEAHPAPDGSWTTTVTAVTTADYRAASGAGVSQTRRLLVSSRRVLIHATRAGVAVTVTPSDPYARVVLELDLRERFGWWPATTRRLDYVSRAEFAVARPARVRAILVDRDGWTALATSAVVVLRRQSQPARPRTRLGPASRTPG